MIKRSGFGRFSKSTRQNLLICFIIVLQQIILTYQNLKINNERIGSNSITNSKKGFKKLFENLQQCLGRNNASLNCQDGHWAFGTD